MRSLLLLLLIRLRAIFFERELFSRAAESGSEKQKNIIFLPLFSFLPHIDFVSRRCACGALRPAERVFECGEHAWGHAWCWA
jgi:hypothetical protein